MLILLSPPLFLSFSVMCFSLWGSFSDFFFFFKLMRWQLYFNGSPGSVNVCCYCVVCLPSLEYGLCEICAEWPPSRSMLCFLQPAGWPSRQVCMDRINSLRLASGWLLLLVEHWQEPGGSGESAFRAFVPLAPSLGESHQDGCVLDWKSRVLPNGLSTNSPGCTNYFLPPQAPCWSLWPSFVIPLCPADPLNYPCLKSPQLKKKK